MTFLIIIEAVVIVFLAVLVAGLLRSHAEILRNLHQLGVGDGHDHRPGSPTLRPTALEPVPGASIVGMTPAGVSTAVSLSDSRGYAMLAFLSSGCGTCQHFWKAFSELGQTALRPGIRSVIVTKSAADESLSDIKRLAPPDVLCVMSTETWDQFEVPYTPYFVLVDTERGAVVGNGAAASSDQLIGLVDRALGDQAEAESLHRSTTERITDTDEELRRAGIGPGDAALYRRPTEEP